MMESQLANNYTYPQIMAASKSFDCRNTPSDSGNDKKLEEMKTKNKILNEELSKLREYCNTLT